MNTVIASKPKHKRYSNGLRRFPRPRWWTRRVELSVMWVVFLATHVFYAWQATWHPSGPFNDVTIVYRGWIDQAVAGDIPGIHSDYVYPVVSLIPMWLADVFGGRGGYMYAWMGIVIALDSLALWWLTRNPHGALAGPRRLAAWWWTIFLLLLGTIAFGRIDAITVPIAIIALSLVMTRPAIAGALMTLGAWTKVWPAALFASAFVAIRRRWMLVLGAIVVCVSVMVGVVAIGGFDAIPHALSFVSGQGDRGLQVESTAASFFLMLHALGLVYYKNEFSQEILTQEIEGPGTQLVGDLLTPLMFVMMLVLMGLAVLAKKQGMGIATRLPALTLGSVATFIVVNKVGSPQFITWLAPVIIFGLVWDGRRFLPLAIVALSISLLTQLVYPWYYWQIVDGMKAGAFTLLVRNLLVAGLMVWALVHLARGAFAKRSR